MKPLPGKKSGRLLTEPQHCQPEMRQPQRKKIFQKPNRTDPSVATRAALPAVGSNTHGAIYSRDEYAFFLLRGFNNMEQMKDVNLPGILSGQQCII